MNYGKEDAGLAPRLAIRGLTVVRDGNVILRDIHWRVERGEHWVVLGGNGSGKTTLLSALTGYLMPTEGEIHLLGETYGESDWRVLRKQLGIVSSSLRQMMANEEPALSTVVSGLYAMVDLWGRPKPADVREARKILKRIECAHLADRPWAVLSQGERQRILIGRALIGCPSVLILDEPCVGLDPAAREHFLQFLERLEKVPEAPTLVLVTHHVEEITPLYTHVLMLNGGKVTASGPVGKVLRSKTLSTTFGTETRLTRRGGRYTLEVSPSPKVWV